MCVHVRACVYVWHLEADMGRRRHLHVCHKESWTIQFGVILCRSHSSIESQTFRNGCDVFQWLRKFHGVATASPSPAKASGHKGGMPSLHGRAHIQSQISDVWSSDVRTRVPRLLCREFAQRKVTGLSSHGMVVTCYWKVGVACFLVWSVVNCLKSRSISGSAADPPGWSLWGWIPGSRKKFKVSPPKVATRRRAACVSPVDTSEIVEIIIIIISSSSSISIISIIILLTTTIIVMNITTIVTTSMEPLLLENSSILAKPRC